VSGTDWLLALHVLSAVFLIGSFVVFWLAVLATRPSSQTLPDALTSPIVRPAGITIAVGTVGTIVFGVWLAIVLDEYQVWDGWILGSLALWAVATGTGERSGTFLNRSVAGEPEARGRGIQLLAVSSLATFLILLLMIWKPGA
jgi:hypothetical protein